MFEDMVENDDRDWMDIASSKPVVKKEETRPRTTGSIDERKKSDTKIQKADDSALDWLGAIQRNNDADKIGSTPEFLPSRGEGRSRHQQQASKDEDDWLGLGSSLSPDKNSVNNNMDNNIDDSNIFSLSKKKDKKMVDNSANDDDWLGLGEFFTYYTRNMSLFLILTLL